MKLVFLFFRQSDNLRLPFVKLESTKKAFFYHGCGFLMKTCNLLFNPRTSKEGGGSNGPPIGFSDLKFEAFK